jgi:hypothetical protein
MGWPGHRLRQGGGLYSRNPDPGGARADPRETVKQLEGSSRSSGGSVGPDGEDSQRSRPGKLDHRVARAAVGCAHQLTMGRRVSSWSCPSIPAPMSGPRSRPAPPSRAAGRDGPLRPPRPVFGQGPRPRQRSTMWRRRRQPGSGGRRWRRTCPAMPVAVGSGPAGGRSRRRSGSSARGPDGTPLSSAAPSRPTSHRVRDRRGDLGVGRLHCWWSAGIGSCAIPHGLAAGSWSAKPASWCDGSASRCRRRDRGSVVVDLVQADTDLVAAQPGLDVGVGGCVLVK